MSYSRRLHHRPVDPAWLELSASSEGEARVAAESESLIARERQWATALGAVAGGIGGALMLVTAQTFLDRQHSGVDAMAQLGARIGSFLPVAAPAALGIGAAVALGAVLGSLFGRLTWRVSRIVPRVLFFAILAPTIWIFAHAIIIGHLYRGPVSALPFAPFGIGALVYGLCLAILPALRRTRFQEILPEK